MPTMPPPSIPQLDGPPPSPPSTGATDPAAGMSFSGMGPANADAQASGGGELQTVQLLLQTAQAVAQGLDILGQLNPALSALSADLTSRLRTGVRSALQQGSAGPEPSSGATFSGMQG